MNARTRLLIACILTTALSPAFAADMPQAVQTIIDKVPAANPSATQANAAQLVELGADAVKALCAMLVEPGAGSDAKARYALDGLAVYVARPGAEAERLMFVKAIGEALAAAQGSDVKQFLLERLQRTGKDESVEVIAPFLADERLCEPAAMALQAIATDNAAAALAAALPKAKGNNRVTLVAALGNLKYAGCVPAIVADAKGGEANLRRTALYALAQIGDPAAGRVLAQAARAKGAYERAHATACYLLYAARLAEQGKAADGVKICLNLLENDAPHVRCAALSTLVGIKGEEAIGDLLAAVNSGEPELTAAALGLAQNLGGASATQAWIAQVKSGPAKAAVINMLAARGDKAALNAIIEAFGDADQDVRTAALAGAVTLGGEAAIDSVIQFIKTSKADAEVKIAAETLGRLPGEAVLNAIAAAVPQSPARAHVALIETLAARKARAHSKVVLAALDGEANVHAAAAKALVDVAGPADIDALLRRLSAAENDADRTALERAIVAAAMQETDEAKRAAKIVAALEAAEDAQKPPLIAILGRIGGKAAIDAVSAVAARTLNQTGAGAVLNDAAVRALAGWPKAEATSALLHIIEQTNNVTHRVLALRGLVRLVNTGGIDAGGAAAMYARALQAVERTDEKKLVIGGLANIRTVDALRLVVESLGDPELKTEAAMAVVKIVLGANDRAEPLAPSHEVVVALRQAMPAVADEKVRARMNKVIEAFVPSKDVVVRPAPVGFVPLFNGKDLTGWKGLLAAPYDNPIKRATLDAAKLKELQARADETMRAHWRVENGVLHFDGRGFSLATTKNYKDFEMLVDWRICEPRGDSGIYLRGSPQVQIWDPQQHGVGSGGLYNNQKNPSKPSVTADNPIGTWNTFRIRMVGDKVTVWLNGILVVDNVVMENYWDRSIPIFDCEQIELQCHGNPIDFANIFIRELPRPGEFRSLFNGRDLAGWVGDTGGYVVEDGKIVCKPGGNLYTEEQFDNFHFKFEFKLTPGANNGLGIRTPRGVDAAYAGMELQILDNTAKIYEKLQPYQYHGSIYGVVPAKLGYLKPVGEWNSQEVIADGTKIKVILNGETIVDADIQPSIDSGTMDNRPHPGLGRRTGHIGFLGHGSVVEFRNIQIQEL